MNEICLYTRLTDVVVVFLHLVPPLLNFLGAILALLLFLLDTM